MTNMHSARKTKPKPGPQCSREGCGHWKWEHTRDDYHRTSFCVHAVSCTCRRYQPPKKEPRRRSIRAQAKDTEREAADLFGGKRVPAGVAAQQRQGDADVVSANRLYQVKHRAVPGWFKEGWEQAEVAARGTGKRPLLVIRTKPGPGQKAQWYVVQDAHWFLEMNGRDDGKEAQA